MPHCRTRDVQAVTGFAVKRVGASLSMPGDIEIVAAAPIGKVVADLALIVECLAAGEPKEQVLDLPL